MKIVKATAGMVGVQKDGTYKVIYWGRDVLTRKPASKAARKPAKRKPKAA